MAKIKSQIVGGAGFMAEFTVEFFTKIKELGGNDETIYNALKTDSPLIDKWAKDVVEFAKTPPLKNLKLINSNISISTRPFKKDSFFKNGPVKLYLWDNFKNWILKAIPSSVPSYKGKLIQTEIIKNMYDNEILNELNNPKPFTISEFTAILCDLLTKQANGEKGTLLNNGHANIFYVQLEDRVVAVSAYWDSGDREWSLRAYALGDGIWSGGHGVFSRS